MTWRDREIEKLNIMWPGISDAAIKAALKTPLEVKRPKNSDGKVSHGNKGNPKANAIVARQSVHKDLPLLRSSVWDALPGTQPVPLEERRGCKWPLGSEKPFLFCDEPTTGRYCPHHEAISTRKI